MPISWKDYTLDCTFARFILKVVAENNPGQKKLTVGSCYQQIKMIEGLEIAPRIINRLLGHPDLQDRNLPKSQKRGFEKLKRLAALPEAEKPPLTREIFITYCRQEKSVFYGKNIKLPLGLQGLS